MGKQLTLDLPVRVALGREDFLVAPCNRQAVACIDAFPDWSPAVQCLYGPSGCGKTHLAAVLGRHYKVTPVSFEQAAARVHAEACLAGAFDTDIVLIDGLERGLHGCEEIFFHMLNHAHNDGAPILLLTQTPPAHIATPLPDLASRLRAIQAVAMHPPDDVLLAGLVRKLFADRQLRVDRRVIDYMVVRIERDFTAIAHFVDRLDNLALQQKRSITVPFVAGLLAPHPSEQIQPAQR